MKKITILRLFIALLTTMSLQLIGQTVEFEDDFENGSANWDLTGAWGLTDAQSYSPTHSMTDSPGGNYSANQNTYCTMTTGVDLSDPSILSASVSFWSIYDIETSIDFDWVKVQASDDDFATSANLGIFNGEGNLDPWIEYSYSLGAYVGSSNVKVRFYFHSDGGYEVDGIYFDDFVITSSDVDNAPPYIGYDNPPTFYEGSLFDYVFMAQLIDASGIQSSKVNYQVEGGDWQIGDGVNISGDDYEFTIPYQTPGSMVVFNVEATDASANNNTAITDDYKYITGEYMYYDDPEVAFYTNLLAGDGSAVVFTLEYHTQIVTGLIRNYQDQSLPPNKNFMFHVWGEGANGPGDDLITPFEVTPAASPADPNPMTVVDLRAYSAELSMSPGDVFIGITIPEDTVKITMANLIANRSFALSGGSWGPAAYDFHFRMITTGGGVGIDDNNTTELESAIMFPNPATDVLYIDSKNEILSLKVVNTAGQQVYSKNINLLKTQIDVNNLQAGIYFVQVETVNGISTKKIIIK
ncbi:MAG: T9SS type A sorting domain-containing protein [Bacteroidetes bacterium]|nr:T9SS type A sorting domain-containing protein [Bacteroidota bacterium]MBL6944208.1 T9SS type A sorting domain-containing protein [Bacteroidales bacterium]